jgi:hypothetical protein
MATWDRRGGAFGETRWAAASPVSASGVSRPRTWRTRTGLVLLTLLTLLMEAVLAVLFSGHPQMVLNWANRRSAVGSRSADFQLRGPHVFGVSGCFAASFGALKLFSGG